MSRVFGTFLLVTIVFPPVSLSAQEPAKEGGVIVAPEPVPPVRGSQTYSGVIGGGTLSLSGTNAYTGRTTVQAGILAVPAATGASVSLGVAGGTCTMMSGASTLQLGTPAPTYTMTFSGVSGDATTNTFNAVSSGVLTLSGGGVLDVNGYQAVGDGVSFDYFARPGGVSVGGVAAAHPTAPIPAGPVFYIITEGAGLGDSVRSVPCTGKVTVLDAVGAVNGMSQISSTKIWIARPLPASPEKSTILPVDWEAISKHGINTTNYTLMPGDRLVFGEDPLITRTNLVGKKTAILERLMGIVSLTDSALRGLQGASAADIEVLKELARKGMFSDDEELKGVLQEMIRLPIPNREKAGSKAAEKKVGQAEKKPNTAVIVKGLDFVLDMDFSAGPGEEKSKAAGPKATPEQKPGQAEKGLVLQWRKRGSDEIVEPKPVQAEKKSNAGGTTVQAGTLIIELKPSQGKEKSNAAGETPPHELAMRPLPAYRIEPPDVISIEMLKLVPMQPYRARIYDVFQIRVYTADLPPIDNKFMVQADGAIDFGPPYGSVKVIGKTKKKMLLAVKKWIRQWIRDPEVFVQLANASGIQPVTGQYLVGPDGTVNLRAYGRVSLMGMTVAEARLAIQKQLATYMESPDVSVDVVAYNSKVYYLITQGAGSGDNVRRLPVTGNDTVLAAISQINGLSAVSSQNIWVVRPLASDPQKATILSVDWDGITRRGATATNYQIFPGDRIYIGEDPLVTRTNLIGKKTAPIERLMGVVGLANQTLRGLNGTSAANDEVLKELVRKGMITDDEELKALLQEAIRLHAQEREKARPKAAEKK